jgi:predicted CopG family antitoxin
MAKKKAEKTTIALEIPVYTQLKDLKIIPEESFNSVIKRLLANTNLKGQRKIEEWTSRDLA